MTHPAPPAVPVFPAGYGPVPADFNGWVQSSLTFLTNRITFRADQGAVQNIASGGAVILRYDTVIEDPYGGWDAANFRWLAPFTGWYEITVFGSIQQQQVDLWAYIYVTGGAQQFIPVQHTSASGFPGGVSAGALVWLTGTEDYVQGALEVSSACSTNTSTSGWRPRLEIVYARQ